MERLSYKIDFDLDFKFWSTGCINLNFHVGQFEIEFLCFGIYVSRIKNKED